MHELVTKNFGKENPHASPRSLLPPPLQVNPAEISLSSSSATAADEATEEEDNESEAEGEDNGETAESKGEAEGEEKADKAKKKKSPKDRKKKKRKSKPAPPPEPVPEPDEPGSYRRDVVVNIEMSLLEHVENLEERIAQASMQFKVRVVVELGMNFVFREDFSCKTRSASIKFVITFCRTDFGKVTLHWCERSEMARLPVD